MTGNDLARLPDFLGCSVARVCGILGITNSSFHKWTSVGDEQLPNATAARVVRFLFEYPKLAEREVDLHDVKAILGLASLAELAEVFGQGRANGHRWNRGGEASEMIRTLAAMIKTLHEQDPAAARRFLSLAQAEKRARKE